MADNDSIFCRWQLTPVINAAGTKTSIGASRVAPEVRADVAAVLDQFVAVDDLQARANTVIKQLTGAEAGCVTACSAAAITLGVAATMIGSNLAAIEALPGGDVSCRRVAVQMGHMINYGAPIPQAIALAGAEVVPLGTAALCEGYHLEAALRQGLAAAVYVVSHHTVREGELPLDVFIETCRRYDVPVIVDMASEYDLTGPIALGADVVIYSGHKFLSGTTSGIVAGRRRLVKALYLQHRGIGRKMKVGKEGIVGAIAALELWQTRDHGKARRREQTIVEQWQLALSDVPGLVLGHHADWTGNPITRLELRLDPVTAGLYAWELAERLFARSPRIAVRDDLAEHRLLYLDPCNLTPLEARQVAEAIIDELSAARRNNDGCRLGWSELKRRRARASVPWLDGGEEFA